MRNIILCIDDDPGRYNQLAKREDITCVVTCRLEEVNWYLELYAKRLLGICLDHDMPFQNGMYFTQHVLFELMHPVLIVSHNSVEVPKMADVLMEWCVPFEISAAEQTPQWAERALVYFRSHYGIQHTPPQQRRGLSTSTS